MANAPPSFGLLLRRYRAAAGLTQEALAERAGLSARGISDLERGERERPHRDTVQMLAAALGLPAEERGLLLAAARVGGPASGPDGAAEPPTNLPTPLTSLIGRAEDSRAVCILLLQPDVRLVTLSGAGGVGKTRLALQAAAELRDAFADGRCFVPLAALRDPALVLPTTAHLLGLSDKSDEPPLARLTAHLGTKRLLLVLDNFEHLLGAAPVVSALLAACPHLKVLATSRARLHVTGEHEYVVPPLALPAPEQASDLGRLRQSPAAALFLERLSAFAPRSGLAADDAPAIAAICARLDGLPLALELAAARGKHLGVPELAARLQRRLQLLTNGPRDLPLRQQTLRATLTWSYDLLAPAEQRLLRWLAAFAGGWTAEQAEALCREEGDGPGAVLDSLAALIDGSLVQVQRGADGRTRYGMLETVREFAADWLAASGEEAAARRRQGEVVLAFTDQAERGLQSGERTAWSRAAAAELDNVRAALRWALDHGETERALRIVGNLDWFWDAVARDGEGWAWSKEALAKADADRAGWGYARALNAAGAIAWNLGDFAASTRLLTESIARFRALDDRRSLGQALTNLALTVLYQGDSDVARLLAIESIAHLEAAQDAWNLGLAHFALGEMLLDHDAAAARAAYERSLARFRSVGDPWGIALATTGLGGLAMRRRDYATARALLEEGLALCRSIDNSNALATSLTSLGELARREGDLARATAYLAEGLARYRALGDAEHVAWALYNVGLTAAQRGDADAAAAALAECLALRVEQGNPAQIAKAIAGAARVAVLRAAPAHAARLWGAAEGLRAGRDDAMPADEDEEEARCMRASLRATLGERAAEAFAAGRALTLAEAVRLARVLLA